MSKSFASWKIPIKWLVIRPLIALLVFQLARAYLPEAQVGTLTLWVVGFFLGCAISDYFFMRPHRKKFGEPRLPHTL